MFFNVGYKRLTEQVVNYIEWLVRLNTRTPFVISYVSAHWAMTFPKKTVMIAAAALAAILGGTLAGGQQPAIAGSTQNGNAMPLEESKVIIEHNDKDKDSGF